MVHIGGSGSWLSDHPRNSSGLFSPPGEKFSDARWRGSGKSYRVIYLTRRAATGTLEKERIRANGDAGFDLTKALVETGGCRKRLFKLRNGERNCWIN